MKTEPVLVAGGTVSVVGLIMAGLLMCVSLGWFSLTPEQLDAIKSFLIPAAAIIGPVVGALIARRFVTPTAAPRTPEGEPAVLVPAAQAQMLGIAPLDDPEAEPLPRWESGRDLR